MTTTNNILNTIGGTDTAETQPADQAYFCLVLTLTGVGLGVLCLLIVCCHRCRRTRPSQPAIQTQQNLAANQQAKRDQAVSDQTQQGSTKVDRTTALLYQYAQSGYQSGDDDSLDNLERGQNYGSTANDQDDSMDRPQSPIFL